MINTSFHYQNPITVLSDYEGLPDLGDPDLEHRLLGDWHDIDTIHRWIFGDWVFMRTVHINDNIIRMYYNVYDLLYHMDEWFSRDWQTTRTTTIYGCIITRSTRIHLNTIYYHEPVNILRHIREVPESPVDTDSEPDPEETGDGEWV